MVSNQTLQKKVIYRILHYLLQNLFEGLDITFGITSNILISLTSPKETLESDVKWGYQNQCQKNDVKKNSV